MSSLSNIPQQPVLMTLAARKSFSFTVQFLDSNERPLSLPPATTSASFTIGEQAYSDSPILTVQAATIVESSGTVLFNLQASQLDLVPGIYPCEVVLISEGYSSIGITAELEIEPSYEMGSLSQSYSEAPSTFGLTAHMKHNRIVVTSNALMLQGPAGETGPAGRDGNPFGPVEVTYDGEGRIASLTIDDQTTSYIYNEDNTIAYDERDGVTRTYNYVDGLLTTIEPQEGI